MRFTNHQSFSRIGQRRFGLCVILIQHTSWFQVSIEAVSVMSDEELKGLGIEHLGDRVILRNICKNMTRKCYSYDYRSTPGMVQKFLELTGHYNFYK